MAEAAAQTPDGVTQELEEAAFDHETTLNATWTGSRLAVGALSFGFGAFVFAYFYLRSLNSHGMWHPAGFKDPQSWAGATVMGLIVASAVIQVIVLQRIKAGDKRAWQAGAGTALALGVGAVGLQVWQLLKLPFYPGSAGYASVFAGATPVFVAIVFCAMLWLEILIAKSTRIPVIDFVEQPATYARAFRVQRFQASLSAYTLVWNYLAVIAVLFWVLFYPAA
jgi:heme/copper-type cytochrome/quinol oxidase subunit 3